MGFDNECILNIQSLAGEYFCPVCRLLVYPNEALQSQCTHLYCKSCVTYVVSTTRACPYDGYLVTEADAKPLVESNKALAEMIGKIAVHCLYHRSGCTWQGPLSDCTSHCSSCAFGNSPVVCNRCGIQIVHHQVQDHAQICSGVQAQAQPAEGITGSSASGTATTAVQTQAATQIGSTTSQTQGPQAATATIPGADPSSQAQVVVQAAAPTADHWYQQQYQQYYQQYPGYDPYQQQYQQYYPYQQPGIPQPQQPLQANPPYGVVQPQPQAYLQPPLLPQSQPQLQTQPSQSQAQSQPQVQLQLQPPMAVQTQNQTSVSQLQPAVGPHSQSQAQTYPSAPVQAQLPSQAYFQAHMPQYQQPQVQQLQQNSQLHPSQLQQNPQFTQSQLQQNPQLHPSQTMNATVHSQTQLPSSNASTGHHLFPQSHLHQPVISAAPQQRTIQSQGVLNPQLQNHGQSQLQFPQQPPLLRPPPFQSTIPNQQQTALLPSPNIISAQQPPVHSFAQQPGISPLQRPIMQPVQQLNPQQYFHTQSYVQQTPSTLSHLRPQGQSQSFSQHVRASNQSQQNVALSQGMQHIQPSNLVGRPMMPGHGVLPQPYAQTVGVLPRPMYPGQNHQSINQNNIGRTNNQVQVGANSRPTMTARPAEKEAELPAKDVAQDLGVSSAVVAESEIKTVKSEVDMKSIVYGNKSCQGNSSAKEIPESRGMLGANGESESESKPTLKEEGVDSTLENSSNGKLDELVAEGAKDVPSSGMKPGEHKELSSEEAQLHGAKDQKLQKDASSTEEGSRTVSTSSAPIGQVQGGSIMQPSQPGSAILQRPGAPPWLQVPSSGAPHHILGSGQPLTHVRPQGPGHVPGQPSHPSEHFQSPRGLYNQNHAPRHSGAPRGPPFALPPSGVDSHAGIKARAAPHDYEGQRGQQRPAFQMEQGITGQASGIISNMLRMNGNPGFESSSTPGLRDERFNPLPDGRLNPFPGEPTRIVSRFGFGDELKQFPRPSFLDPEPFPKLGPARAFDRRPLEVNYDARLNTDPAAGSAPRFLSPYGHGGIHANDTGGHPDFGGRRLVDGFARRSPIRDYPGIPFRGFRGFGPDDFDGREFHRFGDPLGREFHENRFSNVHNHFHRGEFEGPGNMRMRNDLIGQDGPPGHLRRGEHLGPHNLPGNMHLREHVGFGVHPRHAGPGSFESIIGNRASHPRLGEPGFRSSFSLQRFPNDGTYTGEMDSFDHSRKRKPATMGWCRICKVDCETVEGLDVHSQTREHQRMAMEMVKTIKQNAKKQKLASADQPSVEDPNKSKISSFESEGEKH